MPYTGSGAYSTGDGYITLNNETLEQTISFTTGPSTRIWFAGNGVDSYLVQKAWLEQGVITREVLCNGSESFYVPAYGRYSDFFSINDFSLPGDATLYTTVKLKAPYLAPIIGDSYGRNEPAVSIGEDPDNILDYSTYGFINVSDNSLIAEGDTITITHAGGTDVFTFTSTFTEEPYSITIGANDIATKDNIQRAINKVCGGNYRVSEEFYGLHFEGKEGSHDFIESVSGRRLGWDLYWGTGKLEITSEKAYTGNSCLVTGITERAAFDSELWDNFESTYENNYAHWPPNTPRADFIFEEHFWLPTPLPDHTNYTCWIDGFGRWDFGFESFTTDGVPEWYWHDGVWSDNYESLIYGKWATLRIEAVRDRTYEGWESDYYSFITYSIIIDGEVVDSYEYENTYWNEIDYYWQEDFNWRNSYSDDQWVETLRYVDSITFKPSALSPVTIIASNSEISIIKNSAGLDYYHDDDDEYAYCLESRSSATYSTLAALTCSGEAYSHGDLGDNYILVNMPSFTASGTGERSGNVGAVMFPAFTASGRSFSGFGGVPTNMTCAEKLAILMYGNDYMEWVASLAIAEDTDDGMALQAVQYVASQITYATDTSIYGVADYWMNPQGVLYYRIGDCEDGASLVASLMLNIGVTPNRIRIYIGESNGVGHCWVAYKRQSDNQWVALDWTLGSSYWATIDDIDDIDALYPTILEIVENDFDPDDYSYGKGTEYFTYSECTTLVNNRQYLDSLDSSSYLCELEQPIGSISCTAEGGGYFSESIKGITIDASGYVDHIGKLSKTIAGIAISAFGYSDKHGTFTRAIPSVRLSALGEYDHIASLERSIAPIRLTSSAIAGMIGSLEQSISGILLSGNAWWLSGGTLEKQIPSIKISSKIDEDIELALVMNLKNYGLSTYTEFPYNSMCTFNGKTFAAKSDGIYELTGGDDNNEMINWKVRTPQISLDKNKLREVWLYGKTTTDISMVVETADGTRYEYDGFIVSQEENSMRVKVGKGIRSRYIILEFTNENDGSITIDDIQGYGVKL